VKDGLYLKTNNMIQRLIYLKYSIDCAKYPSMPPEYVPKTKYNDKTANGLTKCIVDWINLNGFRADRVSSAGRYIDSKKIVTDILGKKRTIGSGTWVKSGTRRGYSDINATIKGRSVMIEVKIGKDRMSEDQKQFAEAEKQAGGEYWVVKDFEDFMFYYDCFIDYINNGK
jgi:hypothetical protein